MGRIIIQNVSRIHVSERQDNKAMVKYEALICLSGSLRAALFWFDLGFSENGGEEGKKVWKRANDDVSHHGFGTLPASFLLRIQKILGPALPQPRSGMTLNDLPRAVVVTVPSFLLPVFFSALWFVEMVIARCRGLSCYGLGF